MKKVMKRILVGLAGVVLLSTGLVPARASHPTQICLDAEPDRHYPTAGDDIVDVLRVTVGATDDGHPPEQEGCVFEEAASFEGTEIDAEISGDADPDDSNSPETPDVGCTVPEDNNYCFIEIPGEPGAEQTIATWIDFDPETTELDRDELQSDEDTDATDVALWTWRSTDIGPPGLYRYESKVTIRSDDGVLHGAVRSAHRRCVRYRVVTLKRVRAGADRTIAELTTNDRGLWRLRRRLARGGRFYARAGQVSWEARNGTLHECDPGRSATIRIRS